MRIPGCELVSLPLPQPTVQPGGRVDFMISIGYFVPGGGLLFNRVETASGNTLWACLKDATSQPVRFDVPAKMPVLAANGDSIGWIDSTRAFVRKIDESEPYVELDLEKFGRPYAFTLLNLDVEGRELLVHQAGTSFMTLGFEGEMRSSVRPDNVDPQPQTFLQVNNGWVAWDAYRDRDAYRVRWDLSRASGSHLVLKGRGINSVSTNPSGTLIAISVTTSLNIGNIPDAVYVLSAKDGSEVFRRFFPTYTRSNVLFASDELFVYSADGKTYILRPQYNK
ncbi:MAG: hypothetical protein HY646_01525 [Acidobacteria bacterium]|nr:hypothetical protein [Acidobacteriota bacterium]